MQHAIPMPQKAFSTLAHLLKTRPARQQRARIRSIEAYTNMVIVSSPTASYSFGEYERLVARIKPMMSRVTAGRNTNTFCHAVFNVRLNRHVRYILGNNSVGINIKSMRSSMFTLYICT